MSTVFAERPHFFEGQYLGAEDLEQLLDYLREQFERHLLGAHTWGIVAGIDLVGRNSPTGGTFEYFLTPGVAVDGYGRAIVVMAPAKLDVAQFSAQPTGLVDVWIRYSQEAAGGVRRGFETCDAVDAFQRVNESFAIEVGLRTTVESRQAGVTLGDTPYNDAREALGDRLAGRPIACDSAVAAQLFPTGDDPDLWLVPVGRVSWQQGSPGSFVAPADAALKLSMIFRRQAGLVAGSIYAANGLLRLRPRFDARSGSLTLDQVCDADMPKATDLLKCGDAVVPSEPLWLEAHARFTGDARLFGTRVEWQEKTGTDYLGGGVPLALRRAPAANELGGTDLQLLLGKRPGGNSATRLVIGQAQAKGDPCQIEFDFTGGVFVQEDGRVGIGTTPSVPPKPLTKPLEIRTLGDNGDAIGLQATDGSTAWQVNLGPGRGGLNFTQDDPTASRFFIANNGNVGIGTLTPGAKLDIQQVAVSQGNALGAGKWMQMGAGGDNGRVWFQYGGQLAPLMVMSDLDDPPRIQFQQIGAGAEDAPQFQSSIGHARSLSSDISIMGGSVGIATASPSRLLHVEGTEIHSGGAGGGFSFANRETGAFMDGPPNGERWVWYARGNAARLWSSGDKLAVTPAGNVGIATDTPAEKLDVRGNVKLGANGNYFALGAVDNLRMLAGSVPDTGIAIGNGWASAPASVGVYHVTFVMPFGSTPIVVATLVDPIANDNLICVNNVGVSGFDVVSLDIDPGGTDGTSPQDSAFNFIALGART